MISRLHWLGIAVAIAATASCAHPDAAPQTQPTVGMPNPASVYCVKVGGVLRIDTSTQGARGICVLPDGLEMDEWALFRQANAPR